MKHLKTSITLVMILTVTIGSRTFAQDLFNYDGSLKSASLKGQRPERAMDVKHDNEYKLTGHEQGNFYANPLVLNGKPLDYNEFGLGSKGELTVIKGAALTGKTTLVPFYVYLRRKGEKILIPGKETPDLTQTSVELSEILKFAEPGDQLVIEAVKKEDGPVKSILNLLGC